MRQEKIRRKLQEGNLKKCKMTYAILHFYRGYRQHQKPTFDLWRGVRQVGSYRSQPAEHGHAQALRVLRIPPLTKRVLCGIMVRRRYYSEERIRIAIFAASRLKCLPDTSS